MYRKVLISGVTAAAILGAGGTALALSGSDSAAAPSGTSAGTSAAHGKHGQHGGRGLLRRLEHGQLVTRGKGGTTVTHDLINGTVTSVSSSSITVQAADKISETFSVSSATTVRVRENGKGAASSISKVATGDHVFVAGTGTSDFAAKRIVDIKKAAS